MFKKSIIIVIIQIVGVLLGLLSIYLVAGDMDPAIYSLMGVSTVVSVFLSTFSHLGIETTMMREALYWQQLGDTDKVKEYATQSIVSRLVGLLALLPFVVVYVLYLYHNQYDEHYALILLLFILCGCCGSIIDSMSLIVRSQGDYVFAQLAKMINNDVVKFVAIAIYFALGSNAYLLFVCIAPFPLLVVFLFKTRSLYDWRYVNLKATVSKIFEAKYLWMRNDLDYVKNCADSFIVSLVFPPTIMGSYTIYKTLENSAKSFVEGFFDVLSQNTVKYKCNPEQLSIQERKIKRIAYLFALLAFVFSLIFIFYSKDIVRICNLSRYQHLDLMLVTVGLVTSFYLFGKYESNAIAFFGSSKLNLNLAIVIMCVSLITLTCIYFIPNIEAVLLQRVFVYLLISIVSILIFRKHKVILYNSIQR